MGSTGKITYGEYRFKETVWFTHAIEGLLFFYKVCKILNLDKIIQELLEMLYIVFYNFQTSYKPDLLVNQARTHSGWAKIIRLLYT